MRPAAPPPDQDISLSKLMLIAATRNLCNTTTSVLDRLFLLWARGMKYHLSGGNMNGQGTIYQSATVRRYLNPLHVATEVS